MSLQKLKNAPLKEVIFELHWQQTIELSGFPSDPGFEFAVGRFAEILKPDFPVHRKLTVADAPIKFIGVPLHQYWKGEMTYPVIQHGQCMLAVNEVEHGYIWSESFRPLILDSINKLMQSYEGTLNFNKVILKYIDAVDLDEISPHDFISQNLQTRILNDYPIAGKFLDTQLVQAFELEDSSIMRLSIATGKNNKTQKKVVIWTTEVEKNKSLNLDEIYWWIDHAHTHTSDMFKRMLNPEYYASLDR